MITASFFVSSTVVMRCWWYALENKLLPWPDVMVKSSSWIKLLLVLVMVMVSVVTMAPMYSPQMEIEDMSDSSKRNARSANPSSIAAGTVDKIKILIHGRFLQILRNGTVDGTQDENSDDSEFKIFLSTIPKVYFWKPFLILPLNATRSIIFKGRQNLKNNFSWLFLMVMPVFGENFTY